MGRYRSECGLTRDSAMEKTNMHTYTTVRAHDTRTLTEKEETKRILHSRVSLISATFSLEIRLNASRLCRKQ